ncbi:MAG: tetratricopeptide repeat protein, partial [Armatimonadota bacterium]|nr:tetratricopeptide repeat protein [Armatimonadota bacterium]
QCRQSTGSAFRLAAAFSLVWFSGFLPTVYAQSSVQRVDRILDNTSGLLWTFTDHYFHGGDYPQAVRIDHLLIKMDPHFEDAYSVGAWLEWSDGLTDAAVADLKLGVKNNPDRYDLYAEMGDCYWYWLKKPEAAIPYYIHATSFYQEAPWTTFSALAHAAEKVGDYSRAAVAWRTARLKADGDPQELGPIEANLRRVMGKIAVQEGVSGAGAK